MPFTPSSPVTGATVTGLTSPTYTVALGQGVDSNGKQYTVTALGGTQTGVSVHSVSNPFTLTMFVPRTLKTLQAVNPLSGILPEVPRNNFEILVRKGVLPLAGQAVVPALIRIKCEIPAGSDIADAPSLAALFSAAGGLLNSTADGILSTVKTGQL